VLERALALPAAELEGLKLVNGAAQAEEYLPLLRMQLARVRRAVSHPVQSGSPSSSRACV